jgi:hypothetical protein
MEFAAVLGGVLGHVFEPRLSDLKHPKKALIDNYSVSR